MNQTTPCSNESLLYFVEGLRTLVRTEAEEAQRSVEEVWGWPLERRIASGFALNEVHPEGVLESGLIDLRVKTNLSRFREGDTLFLGRGNPRLRSGIPVTLENEQDERLLLALRDRKSRDKAEEVILSFQNKSGWSLEIDYEDLSHFYLAALDDATALAIGRDRVLPLLTGTLPAQTDMFRYNRAITAAASLSLDEMQTEALAQAFAAETSWLVQGPPGTGKTHLLAQLIRLLVEDGERVLVTSFTHRAINNALARVKSVAPQIPVAKIGARNHAPLESAIENYEYFGTSPIASLEGGYVVGATPFAVRSDRLSQTFFDTIIFDESSQITLPLAIMAMLSGRRYLYFGDHRQLPPVFRSKSNLNSNYRSVFGILTERGMESMLTTSYRLNDALANWPSKTFYFGRLVSSPEARNRRIVYQKQPNKFCEILDPQYEKVFVDIPTTLATNRNFKESQVALELIGTLLACGIAPQELAVVVPYRAQARLIKKQLQESGLNEETRKAIVIDTVERLQGQERDIIILSLTTSRPSFARQIADFFFQPERLNVSVTRARTKLIVLGSHALFQMQSEDLLVKQHIKLFSEFIASAHMVRLDSVTPDRTS